VLRKDLPKYFPPITILPFATELSSLKLPELQVHIHLRLLGNPGPSFAHGHHVCCGMSIGCSIFVISNELQAFSPSTPPYSPPTFEPVPTAGRYVSSITGAIPMDFILTLFIVRLKCLMTTTCHGAHASQQGVGAGFSSNRA